MKLSEIDASKVIFPPLKGEGGIGNAYCGYEGRKSLEILTPNVHCPFGLSLPNLNKTPPIKKHGMTINKLDANKQEVPLVNQLFDTIQRIDDHFIEHVKKNPKEYSGKDEVTDAYLDIVLNKTIKVNKDPKKAEEFGPSLKPEVKEKKVKNEKTNTWDATGELAPEVRGPDGQLMDIMELKGRAFTGMLKIRLVSCYNVNNKSIGLTYCVSAVRVLEFHASNSADFDVNAYNQNPQFDAECIAALAKAEEEATAKAERERLEAEVAAMGTNDDEEEASKKREREEEEEENPAPAKKGKAGGRKK